MGGDFCKRIFCDLSLRHIYKHVMFSFWQLDTRAYCLRNLSLKYGGFLRSEIAQKNFIRFIICCLLITLVGSIAFVLMDEYVPRNLDEEYKKNVNDVLVSVAEKIIQNRLIRFCLFYRLSA